jgi:hypothetical protein
MVWRAWLLALVMMGCGFEPDHEDRVKISFALFKEELRIHHVVEAKIFRPDVEGGASIVQGKFKRDAGKSNDLFQCEGVVDTLLIEMLKAGGTSYEIER